jgi:O-antigen/teichoic acid export membrane protein
MSYVATGLIMCLLAILMFRAHPVDKYDPDVRASYTKYAGPVTLILLIGILGQNLPTVLIAFFTKSDGEVANYFMVQRVSMIFILVSTSVAPILFPRLSRTHAMKDWELFGNTCRKTERMISMMMVPLAAATVALAVPIVRVFLSNDYLGATTALALLSVYALVISLDMAYITTIYGFDRPDINLRLGMMTMCVTLAGFVILIPRTFLGFTILGGGATGAAGALVIGGLSEYVISRYYAKKIANVSSYSRVWVHFAGGIAMGLILFAIADAGFVTRWYELVAVCAAGLGIYLGILWAAKEFVREDVRFFLDLLNVRKMLSYLSSELRGKK